MAAIGGASRAGVARARLIGAKADKALAIMRWRGHLTCKMITQLRTIFGRKGNQTASAPPAPANAEFLGCSGGFVATEVVAEVV